MRIRAIILGLAFVLFAAPASAAHGAITLKWKVVDEARRYEVEICKDRRFVHVKHRSVVDGTTYQWRAAPESQHYWRVRSIDSKGRKGDWSAAETIKAVFGDPELSRPRSGKVFVVAGPSLKITLAAARSAYVASYEFEIARSSTFEKPQKIKSKRHSAKFEPRKIGTYWVRVRATSIDGKRSHFSKSRKFKVVQGKPVVVVNPVDIGEAADLSWGALLGTTKYRVQIATDQGFKKPLKSLRVRGTDASWTASQVGRYFVRARAANGRYSAPIELLVRPVAPTLVTPAANASFEDSVHLTWSPSDADAAIEIARDDAFEDIIWTTFGKAETVVEGLEPGRYVWRVATTVNGVQSRYSEVRVFHQDRTQAIDSSVSQTDGGLHTSDSLASRSVWLQSNLGLYSNFGSVTTARLHVGARWDFEQPWYAHVFTGYFQRTQSLEIDGLAGTTDVDVRVIPFAANVGYSSMFWGQRFSAAAGPIMSVVNSGYAHSEFEPRSDWRTAWGAGLEMGWGTPFGPGYIETTARVEYLPANAGSVEVDLTGAMLFVGYSWGITAGLDTCLIDSATRKTRQQAIVIGLAARVGRACRGRAAAVLLQTRDAVGPIKTRDRREILVAGLRVVRVVHVVVVHVVCVVHGVVRRVRNTCVARAGFLAERVADIPALTHLVVALTNCGRPIRTRARHRRAIVAARAEIATCGQR